MARRRVRSDLDDSPNTARAGSKSSPVTVPPPRRSRFLRRFVVLLVVLGIVVALAPQIVCRTPLLAKLVAWATTDLNGKLTFAEASAGWFSAPQVSQVRLFDAAGEPVLTAESVSIDRTLWQLVTGPTRLGRIRIDRPTIELVLCEDGTTNLEQVLAKLIASSSSAGASTPIDVAVQIAGGVINVHDRATRRSWTVDRVDAVVVVPSDPTAPLVGDVQGSVLSPSGSSRIAAQGSWRQIADAAGKTAPQGDAAVTVESLPLEFVEALARRFVPGLALSGMVQGDLRARFDLAAAQPIGDASGRISLLNFAIGGSLLQGDEVRLSRLDVPLKIVIDGPRLQVDELAVSCDLASVDVRGSLDRYERLASVTGLTDLLNLLVECDGRATAKLDLARISQVLPHVLNIRDDVQITGGDLTVTASSDGRPGERRQQIELHTSGIAARHNGAPIVWDQPLRAVATTRDAPGGPVVERVQCLSDFLTIDGTNSPDSFQLTAEYDLARLTDRLAQFVDLGGMKLQGRGTAKGAWLRSQAQRFEIEGQAQINDFQLTAPGVPAWIEKQLTVGLEAVGRADGLSVASVESGAAGLQSGGDELTVRLLQPIDDVRKLDAAWPVEIAGHGELATWLNRIRPLAGLPADAAAQGAANLIATAKVRLPSDIEIVSSKLTAVPCRLAMYGLVMDEPTAELQLAGRYTSAEMTIREATLASPGLQSQVRQFVWRDASPTTTGELSGDASLRAELSKLVALAGYATPGGIAWGGIVEGGARLNYTGGATQAAIDAVIKNFSAAKPGGAAWQEPLVKLNGTGVYDAARDSIAVNRMELSADALRVLLTGGVTDLSKTRVVQCTGEVDYDLARLTPLAQSYLGNSVALTGRETQRFELAGPLADPARNNAVPWERLSGAARLGWQSADLYGVRIGRGTIDAKLADGIVRTSPIELQVNSGRVRVAPAVRLAGGPMELGIEPGTVVDHVTISPEMANEHLKYVVPILAGITQVTGQFSVAIDELRVPLDKPEQGTLAGRLTVHAVDVGPGGLLTQELATLLQQPLTMKLTRESVVDFKMIQGRIYHQGLEFDYPEVTVRTHGSVGLDQTLSMVAEFSLPQRLLQNRPALGAAATAHPIRLPIAGTLARPQIDRQAFAAATAQFLQGAAQGAVQNGINRGLERLFGPGALAPQPGTATK